MKGRFEDVSLKSGPGITTELVGRGCAFGDLDNDGDIEVVVNNLDASPSLLRNEGGNAGHWLAVELAGDRARLQGYRSSLRARMAASPLMNAAGFTHGLEQAFRRVWEDYCGRESGARTADPVINPPNGPMFPLTITTPPSRFRDYMPMSNALHANGVYKGTPSNCYACHAAKDNHNGQFGTDCGACHTPSGWGNVTFNHNNTSFPLVGHHTQLACTSCHKNGVYKGTPNQCIACHADKDQHNGQNGTDCSICHTPRDWGAVIKP